VAKCSNRISPNIPKAINIGPASSLIRVKVGAE
jgi:hypothetical protein